TRTDELTLPGFRHDVCSAIHPGAASSPFLRSLPLHEFGLEWIQPDVMVAHPLDDGSAGALLRTVDDTAAAMGVDGARFAGVFGGLSRRWPKVEDSVLGPLTQPPRHPLAMGMFGMRALPPATMFAKRFRNAETRGLLAGLAAHAFLPLERPLTSAAA